MTSGILSLIRSVYRGFIISVLYVFMSFRKNFRTFLVGVLTVLVSVCFLSILQNAVYQVPVVFMRMSEMQVGEGDVLIQPRGTTFINTTSLSQELSRCTRCTNSFARMTLYASASNPAYGATVDGVLNIYNSTHEHELNIGRGWEYDPIPNNSFVLSGAAARRLGVDVGSPVDVRIDVPAIARYLGVPFGEEVLNALGLTRTLPVRIPLRFVDPSDEKNGTKIIQKLYDMDQLMNQSQTRAVSTMFVDGLDMFIADAHDYYVLGEGRAVNPYPLFVITKRSMRVSYRVIYDPTDDGLLAAMHGNKTFVLSGVAESPGGKYANSIGNVISLDMREGTALMSDLLGNVIQYEVDLLTDQLSKAGISSSMITILVKRLKEEMQEYINSNLNNLAQQVYVQMKDRVKAYTHSDTQMKDMLIEVTDEIADVIGVEAPVSITTPLKSVVSVFNYLMYLLQQIFNFVLVVFGFLSGLLIYSLLIADVESKTYEFGMLRAIGLLRAMLVEILALESSVFSLMGIVVGLVLGYGGIVLVNFLVASLAALPMQFIPDWKAIVIPVALGVVIPLVANIVPIRRVLSNTLRDALDLYHSSTNEVTLSIKRIESIGVNPTVLVLSVLMVVGSVVTYYVIPSSFMNMNISLLFTCFLFVLLVFLTGLCLLSQVAQPFIQRLTAWLMITPLQPAVQAVVQKNLDAHSIRNKKTSLMLTVSVAFVLFAGAAFALSEKTLTNVIRLQQGSDVMVTTLKGSVDVEVLNKYLDSNKDVLKYTYMTKSLTSILGRHSSIMLSNLAEYPDSHPSVIAVDENFTSTVFDDLIVPVEVDNDVDYDKLNGRKDVISSLFTQPRVRHPEKPAGDVLNHDYAHDRNIPPQSYIYQNYSDALVAEGIRRSMSLPMGQSVRLSLSDQNGTVPYTAIVRGTLKSVPGSTFSSYSTTAYAAPVIVSIDQFKELMKVQGDLRSAPTEVSYSRCLIKAREGSTEDLVQDIRTLVTKDPLTVVDTQTTLSGITSSLSILQVFFAIVSILAMALCFFVMLLTYTSNVHENSWEFAVLRSIGLPAWRVVTVYIYEALAITVSSLLLGALIGVGVAVLVDLQFVLFLQLPFAFSFPWFNGAIVLVASLTISLVASFIPSFALTRKPIASVLKGQH